MYRAIGVVVGLAVLCSHVVVWSAPAQSFGQFRKAMQNLALEPLPSPTYGAGSVRIGDILGYSAGVRGTALDTSRQASLFDLGCYPTKARRQARRLIRATKATIRKSGTPTVTIDTRLRTIHRAGRSQKVAVSVPFSGTVDVGVRWGRTKSTSVRIQQRWEALAGTLRSVSRSSLERLVAMLAPESACYRALKENAFPVESIVTFSGIALRWRVVTKGSSQSNQGFSLRLHRVGDDVQLRRWRSRSRRLQRGVALRGRLVGGVRLACGLGRQRCPLHLAVLPSRARKDVRLCPRPLAASSKCHTFGPYTGPQSSVEDLSKLAPGRYRLLVRLQYICGYRGRDKLKYVLFTTGARKIRYEHVYGVQGDDCKRPPIQRLDFRVHQDGRLVPASLQHPRWDRRLAHTFGRSTGPVHSSDDQDEPSSRSGFRSGNYVISLIGASVARRKPTGHSWDAFGGAPDVYGRLQVGKYRLATRTIRNSFHPRWRASVRAYLTGDEALVVQLVDRDLRHHDLVGTCRLGKVRSLKISSGGTVAASCGSIVRQLLLRVARIGD
ncbi:MAG: hypothetical protein KC503_10370 [Myxococcales bacterium]|nr:hypothetical protein [Myxococcales bacterium]